MLTACLITITALAPAAILFWYIYQKDKAHPEPLGVLIKGLSFGILAALIASAIDTLLIKTGLNFDIDSIQSIGGAASLSLYGAALPEEAAKLFMLWLLLRNNKYYDEYLDGIVYAACIGLGFAGIENVGYLFSADDWIQLGLMRGITAVPAHFTMACAMGYFYSEYHFGKKNKLTAACIFLVPVFIHWLWDTIAFSTSLINQSASLLMDAVFLFFIYRLYKGTKNRIADMQNKDDLRIMPPIPGSPTPPSLPREDKQPTNFTE